MAMKPAFFMVFPNAPASREPEWNDWLNKVHIPARLAMPGFFSARRYAALEGDRKYFHFFGMKDAGVMSTESYLKLRAQEATKGDPSYELMELSAKMTDTYRGIYEPIFPEGETFREPQSDTLLVVGLDIAPEKEQEFNVWYNTEHIPEHLKVPGFIRATRFVSVRDELSPGRKANCPKYVAIYEVENEKAFLTPEYEKSRYSPWTFWMRQFYIRRFRSIFRRIY